MPKSFIEAFEEWKSDQRYQIGEDCGAEQINSSPLDPTSSESSLTPEEDGTTRSDEALFRSWEAPE